MRLLGNILWFIFGGFISWLEAVFCGLLLCVTIIGIPWGMQCFKLARLCACPFGKEINYTMRFSATVGNIFWIILFGWEMALTNLLLGAVLCLTIVGIPWGKQYFKIASVSILPFGAEITTEHIL